MRRLLPILCLTLAVLLGSMGTSWSADFQKGLDAFDRGDYATALREWTSLAEQGFANAQYNLGQMYRKGQGVPQHYKTAVKWFRLAAEQGDANAQSNLGYMYNNGYGVPQHYKTAVKWFRLAAEQGNADAQYNLGLMYRKGKGVPQHYKTAVKWYRLAAEQGDSDAQYKLGNMYRKGQGVPQNHETAVKWYRLAAKQGDANAQSNLGFMYDEGKGVSQNHETAVKWYRLAAEQGNAPAQYNLGNMYRKGKGVPQNFTTALKWYVLASASENRNVRKKAVKGGDNLAKKMTSSQKTDAERLARNFVSRKSLPTTTTQNRSPRSDPDKFISVSSGSGFAVSSVGHVITNNHVINGCNRVKIHHKGKSVSTTVITYDPRNDLALLKGDFRPTTVFSLSNQKPELLQDIYVAGYPFGRKISTSVKVTKGIISSLSGIGNNFSNIQIDAALQPGNSGGPILNDRGNIVGVAVAKLDLKKILKKYGTIPENTNFGIKTSVVISLLESSNVSLRSPNAKTISKSKLGKMISDGTYYLSCWMKMAQFEKIRAKKGIYSNLE